MTQEQWTAVDEYIADQLIVPDQSLDAALRASIEAGLPSYHVSPAQGKLLYLLAKNCQARTILEIGTLGGYSTIWLARALPEKGRLITLEANERYAEVAQANIAGAGLANFVEVRVGLALDTLPQIADEERGPFDVVFIDADKANTPEYFKWAIKLSRVGSLIIVDNTVRDGKLIDADSTDASVQGVRRLHATLASEPRLTATTIQTVGSKGYDGLTFALVVN
jgi:predicted O-methyltransferase YrrM